MCTLLVLEKMWQGSASWRLIEIELIDFASWRSEIASCLFVKLVSRSCRVSLENQHAALFASPNAVVFLLGHAGACCDDQPGRAKLHYARLHQVSQQFRGDEKHESQGTQC